MRRALIKPMPLFDHLERSECLLSLIVIVELPWEIGREKQDATDRANDPEREFMFQKLCRHSRVHGHLVRCIAQTASADPYKNIPLTPDFRPVIPNDAADSPF